MGDFTVKAVSPCRVSSWVLMVVVLGASLTLILLGTIVPDEDSFAFYLYGGIGCGAFVWILMLHYSSQYMVYEDEGDHLRIRFGPLCFNNCIMDCCCPCNSLNGKIQYSDIDVDRLDFTNSTCLDGCGIRWNSASNSAIFTTSCCVPAVEVHSNNTGCCICGRYVLGVEDKTQAEELILNIRNKVSDKGGRYDPPV